MVEFNYHNRTADQQTFKSVQAWKRPKAVPVEYAAQQAEKNIINALEKASAGKVGRFDIELTTANAYADSGERVDNTTNSNNEFKFRDVVDVVNPLHHIPVVSMVYRGITGDELHPMSQIIGGALYGGPVGAVTGTANAITKMQTGKDIGDHALSMAGIGQNKNINSPEKKLSDISSKLSNNQSLNNLPDTALSYVGVAEPQKAAQAYERIQMAGGRTAGSAIVKKNWTSGITNQANTQPNVNIDVLPARESVTTINMSTMPPRRDA